MELFIASLCLFSLYIFLRYKRIKREKKIEEIHRVWYEEIKEESKNEPSSDLTLKLKNGEIRKLTFKHRITSLFCGWGYRVETAKESQSEWLDYLQRNGFNIFEKETIKFEDISEIY